MSPIGRAWASDGPEVDMAALNELLRDLTLVPDAILLGSGKIARSNGRKTWICRVVLGPSSSAHFG